MRVDRLNLVAFGPFTEHAIDLAGPGQLQVIYGDNGAGKTTAMRALQGLLFGIPHQSTDSWMHGKDILIGGSLTASDNRTLEFLRRKGIKNTILDLDRKPLDPDALSTILAGLTQDLFTSMYGLSHQRLRDGGNELLRGRGQLGDALFGASLGAGSLTVLHDLEREADELFRPRGQRQRINAALAELQAATKAQRQQGATVAEWEKLSLSAKQARGKVVALDEQATELRKQQSAAERLRSVLGALAERSQIFEEIDRHAGVPELDENVSQLRFDAVTRLNAAQLAANKSAEVIKRRRKEIEDLDPPQIMIERSGEIAGLFQRIGEIRKDLIDLPSLKRQHREHRADALRNLRDIDPELTIDTAETQRMSAATRSSIKDLASRKPDIDAQLTVATRQHSDTISELKERQDELKAQPDPIDVASLTRISRAIAGDGDLEQRLADDTNRLNTLRSSADLLAVGLGQGGNDCQAVAELSVPMRATVERFREELGDLDRRAETLQGQREKTAGELRHVRERLNELDRAEQIFTQKELDEARLRRDVGWQAVRASWLDGNDSPGKEFDALKPLPDAFEETLRVSDDIADRLRASADRVATKAHLTATEQRLQEDTEEHERAALSLGNERDQCESSWQENWAACGIEAQTPTEMLEWVTRHEELRQVVADIYSARALVSHTTELIAQHRKTLSRVLSEIGEPGIGDDESLRMALARADAARTSAIEASQRCSGLEKAIADLREKRHHQETAVTEAQRALDTWDGEWKAVVDQLKLPDGATLAATMAVLDAYDVAFAHLRDAEKLMARVEGLERDIERFAEDTRTLVSALDPTLEGEEPIVAVESLHERALAAQGDQTTVQGNERQISEESESQASAEVDEAAARRELDELFERAGVEDIGALEAVEQAVVARRKLRDRLAAVEEAITTTGADSVDVLATRAAQTDADELSAQISTLEVALHDLADQRDEAHRHHIETENELLRIQGGTDAAVAAEKAQKSLAEVRTNAERYVRLKLAVILLRQAMDDYRERTQGPVLASARTLFAQLTAGVFDGLATDFNDDNEAIIRAVRGERHIDVELLSDGERDALYLALRIATLEHIFSQSAPIPVVLDDAFLNFDDQRSMSGLKAMHELSRQTQVIFFTHHDHLVNLAQDAIATDGLAVHRLPAPG